MNFLVGQPADGPISIAHQAGDRFLLALLAEGSLETNLKREADKQSLQAPNRHLLRALALITASNYNGARQIYPRSIQYPISRVRDFKMSSAFEPSLSTSRPPLGGPSLADTLPNINFGFDDLRDRMAKFTAKFDAFIEQGRKRVLEERNQFRMNVAELQGKSRLALSSWSISSCR